MKNNEKQIMMSKRVSRLCLKGKSAGGVSSVLSSAIAEV